MAPVNTVKTQPLEPILQELVKMGAQPQGPLFIAVRDVLTATQKTLTIAGQIQPQAPIGTAAVGVGTQTQNLTDTGNLNSLGNVDDTSTDHLTDGAGSPLTGGKRGFNALDTNNRLASSKNNTAVNVTNIPSNAATLSNNGILTKINIASSTQQFPTGPISYSLGVVDPGVFGKYFIYASDPDFLGGAVAYLFSLLAADTAAAEGLVYFGSITTALGAAGTGGGDDGGSAGGSGGALRG